MGILTDLNRSEAFLALTNTDPVTRLPLCRAADAHAVLAEAAVNGEWTGERHGITATITATPAGRYAIITTDEATARAAQQSVAEALAEHAADDQAWWAGGGYGPAPRMNEIELQGLINAAGDLAARVATTRARLTSGAAGTPLPAQRDRLMTAAEALDGELRQLLNQLTTGEVPS
jgi:hypothetical protein